jgi:hypothetical protein
MQKTGTHFEQVPKAEIEKILAQRAAQSDDHRDNDSSNNASNRVTTRLRPNPNGANGTSRRSPSKLGKRS